MLLIDVTEKALERLEFLPAFNANQVAKPKRAQKCIYILIVI